MNHPIRLPPPGTQGLELFDTAALRRLEQAAGTAGGELMERAGLAAARLARALWPLATRISVVCGPGNNGGDGFVVARWLRSQGLDVQLIAVGTARAPSAERQQAARSAGLAGLAAEPLGALDPQAELLIDALLGLGLHAAPDGELAAAIEAMNRHPAPKLAVDLPSGLQADTGSAPGVVVRCTHTLSLLAPTPGLFTGEGRQQAGQLWLDRLACDSTTEVPVALAGSPRIAWRHHSPRARWPHGAHKGRAGRVWVLEGATDMAGAARLAARAALAAGAGRVYLVGEAVEADPLWPELMRGSPTSTELAEGVGVIGCGGGDKIAGPLQHWLERAGSLVVDADALNAIAASPALQQALAGRHRRDQRSLLTPHPLEAARLLACSAAEVQRDRLAAARQLADRFACTVLLKGSGTVIAAPKVLPLINTSGHASLSTAGTGDVLAGWLGGLIAQAPTSRLDELAAIACAWHGEAADQLPVGGGPLRASELIGAMAALQP